MSKGTNIKDAIKIWEDKTKLSAADAETVKLLQIIPSITKMDASLATLAKVRHLALSTNQIDKISNLQGLQFLTILSLGRNNLKKIEGLEAVADTLEELWLSYNLIDRVNGVECCKKLKVLYLSNNKIKDWASCEKIKELPVLSDLLLQGNPLEEKLTLEKTWRDECIKKFVQIKRLDGSPVIRDDEPEDKE